MTPTAAPLPKAPVTLTADMPIQLPRAAPVARTDAAELWCRHNHGQTLERVRERQGFCAAEAVCVLAGIGWTDFGGQDAAHRLLRAMVAAFERGRGGA